MSGPRPRATHTPETDTLPLLARHLGHELPQVAGAEVFETGLRVRPYAAATAPTGPSFFANSHLSSR